MAVTAWIKLSLDIAWAWISLSVLRAFYHPPGSYWVIINRVMQVNLYFFLLLLSLGGTNNFLKAMFSAGMILLVEKLFLHFVAINFHEKALADRLAENRLGLKALDRLSNTPVLPTRKQPNVRRGHKGPGSAGSADASTPINQSQSDHEDASPTTSNGKKGSRDTAHTHTRHWGRRRKRKAITSVIVDQVGEAIGQIAFKNYRLNREGQMGSLYSAKRLARKLFSALNDSYPPRKHLTVEGVYLHTSLEGAKTDHAP